jgi:zinc D-Ala-D-Ala carboxypeptidase
VKKIFLIGAISFFIFSGYASYLFFNKPDYDHLNIVHRFASRCITRNFEKTINNTPADRRSVIDYDTLMMGLNFIERDFARRVFDTDPKQLGCNWQFYSVERPKGLVKISPVIFGAGKETRKTEIQFCAVHSYNDYLRMCEQMRNDIGRHLIIQTGFRSAGIQAYLFFKYLTTISKYSLKDNLKKVAMPGYSQHNNPANNAIDLCSEDGINGFTGKQTAADFERLPEFRWMQANAYKYNFYLTYPKNNQFGIAYEPWHWCWEKRSKN